MFIATLFIIAKTWKQSRCHSIGEWINNLWFTQTMEYNLALKNELLSHEKTWRKLKFILLSERSQLKSLHSNSNYMTFWTRQNREIVKRSMVRWEEGMNSQSTENF